MKCQEANDKVLNQNDKERNDAVEKAVNHIPDIVELLWIVASVLPSLLEAAWPQLIANRFIRARVETSLVGVEFAVERRGILDQDHGVYHGEYPDDKEQYKDIVLRQIREHIRFFGCDYDNALNADADDYP